MARFFVGLFALIGFIGTSTPALAETVGIPVTIEVTDAEGAPIPTAVIRHRVEADRHHVNTVTGRWTADVLYLPDGSELVFAKKTELEFEISAPSYESARVKYVVKKRKNIVQIALDKAPAIEDDEPFEEPIVKFARPKPLDK